MSDNYRVLDEVPKCCATCCWYCQFTGGPGECEHLERNPPQIVSERGLCDRWEEVGA